MTQEDKELLLKDLCARLPYGVKVSYNGNKDYEIGGYHPGSGLVVIKNTKTNSIVTTNIENIVPYLLPLSSMTEEQKFEFDVLQVKTLKSSYATPMECVTILQWCYKNHIDVSGLIPKGLANDATGKNIY